MPTRNMPAEKVNELLTLFQHGGIRSWIDGGWAVDALLGQETRPHCDLDIALQKQDVERTRHVLRSLGYQDKLDEETRPWNFVMADEAGHEIDFHVIEFDEYGNGVYGPPELALSYPADSLTGEGAISGYPVSCISPEWLVQFHRGYDFDEQDVQDVMALHKRFGVPLPDEYIAFINHARDSHSRQERASEQLVEFTPMSIPKEAKEILGAAMGGMVDYENGVYVEDASLEQCMQYTVKLVMA